MHRALGWGIVGIALVPTLASADQAPPPAAPRPVASSAPRSYPLCEDRRGALPLRADFEASAASHDGLVAAAELRKSHERAFLAEEALALDVAPSKLFDVFTDDAKEGVRVRTIGGEHVVRVVIGSPTATWSTRFFELALEHRAVFGFGPGEVAFRDGDRIRKRYPNGAVSEGALRIARAAMPTVDGVLCTPRGPAATIVSTLPPPDPQVAARPVLSGADASQALVALVPYLVPRPGPALVVVRARAGAAKLVWKVGYRFPCQGRDERRGEEDGVAYVDARSGALVVAEPSP